MGARPSTFRKGGGGFLNNVDGTIVGYRWTDQFNGEDFVPGKKDGKEKFHSLFMEISIRLDGADSDETQNLFAGGYDDYEVSEDGLTLTAQDGGECSIGQNTPAGKFLASLVEKGFPEKLLSDDPDSINVEPILGTRVRFAQETVMGKDGKPRKRVAKKGKFKGREFDDTTTVVAQVYDLPGKAGKGGKPAAAKTGKAAKEEDANEDEEGDQTVEALAGETLIDIVKANKGKMAKEKLSMAILQKLMKHPQREPVRKLLKSDDFLETEDGWEYNAKKGVVTVAADEDED